MGSYKLSRKGHPSCVASLTAVFWIHGEWFGHNTSQLVTQHRNACATLMQNFSACIVANNASKSEALLTQHDPIGLPRASHLEAITKLRPSTPLFGGSRPLLNDSALMDSDVQSSIRGIVKPSLWLASSTTLDDTILVSAASNQALRGRLHQIRHEFACCRPPNLTWSTCIPAANLCFGPWDPVYIVCCVRRMRRVGPAFACKPLVLVKRDPL